MPPHVLVELALVLLAPGLVIGTIIVVELNLGLNKLLKRGRREK